MTWPAVASTEGASLPAAVSLPPSATAELQTFTSFDDAHAIAPEWDALITRLNGSLYMTLGWCQVWWRHYNAGRELRLIIVRADDELVGVLPFFIDELRLPFGRARVAKIVGSDSTTALVEPPVGTGVAAEAFALAMQQLFEDDRVDMVHVGPCPGVTAHVDAIRQAAANIVGVAQITRDDESGSHTVFEIREGFDAYMRNVSKNHRSNYRRNLNKLNNTFKFEVDVVRDVPMVEREFEAFVEMHQAQWKAINKLGHFDDWPASREFSRDLDSNVRSDRSRVSDPLARG